MGSGAWRACARHVWGRAWGCRLGRDMPRGRDSGDVVGAAELGSGLRSGLGLGLLPRPPGPRSDLGHVNRTAKASPGGVGTGGGGQSQCRGGSEQNPDLGSVWMDERRGASGPEALDADLEFGLQTSKGDPQMETGSGSRLRWGGVKGLWGEGRRGVPAGAGVGAEAGPVPPAPHTLDEPGPRGWAAPEARALCPGSTTRSSTSKWWRRTAGSTSRKQKSLKASWYVAPRLRGSVAPAAPAAWPRAGKRARAAHCSHTEGEGCPAPRPLQAGLAEGVRAQQGSPAAGLGATSWEGASLPSVGRSQENAFVGHLGTVRASSQP